MPPPSSIKLGPLTAAVLDRAVWREKSVFPAHQEWADEAERVLSFLESHAVLETLMSRLTAREWEGAFAEARAAFFFHRNGFRVIKWEPEAVPGRPGDFEIQWRDTPAIFVEVKGPGWEGELCDDEIRSDRQHEAEHIHLEGRSLDPFGPVLYAIDKALPKFASDRINLLVVVDDLFISPTDIPKEWLRTKVADHLCADEYRSVGGLYLLHPVLYTDDKLEYQHHFVPNELASRPLPESVAEGFIKGNQDPQGPRWKNE